MSALYDPERVSLAAVHAIERARSQGRSEIEPDDLLIGFLYAVSRFGIVQVGRIAIDLVALGLRFDLGAPSTAVKPRYSVRAAGYFDRAARVARTDGAARLAPIHFLAVLGEPGIETFDRLARTHGIDHAGWRAALAACPAPVVDADAAAQDRASAAGDSVPRGEAHAAPEADGHPGGRSPATVDPSAQASAETASDLLTPEDTARLLGMHIQTVRGYIRGGKLPAFRIAGERAIRIRRDDVMSLLESTTASASPSS